MNHQQKIINGSDFHSTMQEVLAAPTCAPKSICGSLLPLENFRQSHPGSILEKFKWPILNATLRGAHHVCFDLSMSIAAEELDPRTADVTDYT